MVNFQMSINKSEIACSENRSSSCNLEVRVLLIVLQPELAFQSKQVLAYTVIGGRRYVGHGDHVCVTAYFRNLVMWASSVSYNSIRSQCYHVKMVKSADHVKCAVRRKFIEYYPPGPRSVILGYIISAGKKQKPPAKPETIR